MCAGKSGGREGTLGKHCYSQENECDSVYPLVPLQALGGLRCPCSRGGQAARQTGWGEQTVRVWVLRGDQGSAALMYYCLTHDHPCFQ